MIDKIMCLWVTLSITIMVLAVWKLIDLICMVIR